MKFFREKLSNATPKHILLIFVSTFVLLLIAGALAYWIWLVRTGNKPTFSFDKSDTSSVISAEFIAPELPKGYIKKDVSKVDAGIVHYTSDSENCEVSTVIQKTNDERGAKDLALDYAKTVGYVGAKISGQSDTDGITIKDEDNQHEYNLGGLTYTQQVDRPGIEYKTQKRTVYYQKFHSKLFVALSFACSDASYDANQQDLKSLIEQFKLKTKR